jgi:hypothetical protein
VRQDRKARARREEFESAGPHGGTCDSENHVFPRARAEGTAEPDLEPGLYWPRERWIRYSHASTYRVGYPKKGIAKRHYDFSGRWRLDSAFEFVHCRFHMCLLAFISFLHTSLRLCFCFLSDIPLEHTIYWLVSH